MTIVEHAIPECNFGDIAVGEAFMSENKVYIACVEHNVTYDCHDVGFSANAICLNDGSMTFFCEDDVVGCPEIKVSVR